MGLGGHELGCKCRVQVEVQEHLGVCLLSIWRLAVPSVLSLSVSLNLYLSLSTECRPVVSHTPPPPATYLEPPILCTSYPTPYPPSLYIYPPLPSHLTPLAVTICCRPAALCTRESTETAQSQISSREIANFTSPPTMSLAGQTMPARESVHSSREDRVTSTITDKKDQSQRTSYRDSLPNAPRPSVQNDDAPNENENAKMYGDYYEEMTGPSPKKTQPAQTAPALPAKSSLRASRLLDGMALKIITNQPTQAAPQEVYLSSEEEASSSADEFSDYDYESDSAESADSPVRRKSQEDTARVVSVVFAGKPSIIDLPSTRRSASPESMESSRPPSRLVISSTAPSLRRMPTSSTSGASFSPVFHPPRSSSMMITSSMLPKEKPSFLSIDPYASKPFDERAEEPQAEPEKLERPKTPTSQLFKRTLSIVRKRSRPQLRDLAANNSSRDRLSSPSLGHLPLSAHADIREEPEQKAPWSAVSYHDIMRAAKKNAQNQPPTPSTPVAQVQSPSSPAGNTRSRILSGFTNRRKSIKIG
ncbi:hypothetical protein CSPX01_01818 [Colletotrichum filicis]|nr:hypothetical protein CSPX01_01818 [Colletotrichum filicis]